MKITEPAVNRIRDLIIDENKSSAKYFRVSVVGGGCIGLQYSFNFDDTINSDDVVIEELDVTVLVDAISLTYLNEATLEYLEKPFESRFVINNPKVTTTCGCGSSFNVEMEVK